jgi:glycerol 3-phosphatase-2
VEPAPRTLGTSATPLVELYDCAMLDLDGVVYVGGEAVTGVPDVLRRARDAGMTLAFVTNNAARTPGAVAENLRRIGVDAHDSDVVTSAQAAAREVSNLVPPGSKVLVVGGEGLQEALRAHELEPVDSDREEPTAVVQGFHPGVGWALLAEGGYALRRGVPWVASNLDVTVPTSRGVAPGNGALVEALAVAVGRRPDVVAGKPFRPLFDETVLRTSSRRPIVIGDRLDTDIEGAVTCGADSLLVMTGVTDVHALCRAPSTSRPDYVSWTMQGLLTPHPAPTLDGDGTCSLSGWVVGTDDDVLVIRRTGVDAGDGLRAVAMAAWHAADRSPGHDLDTSGLDELWPPGAAAADNAGGGHGRQQRS